MKEENNSLLDFLSREFLPGFKKQKKDETLYYINVLILVVVVEDEPINVELNDVADIYLADHSYYQLLPMDQWFYENILTETGSWEINHHVRSAKKVGYIIVNILNILTS